MKKSQKKRTKRASGKPIKGNEQSFNDLGIDPPKIYRDTQRSAYPPQSSADRRQPSRNSKTNNLTHAEKRKKDDHKRKKRNKFRKALIWLVVIIAFVATGTVLSLTVFFQIDTIEVTGETNYELDEILAQCTIDKGENLFLSDTQTAKQMLEKNLPYIYNAEIKRKLPYTIEIQITTAQSAYSIMNKDKTYILLDDRFKVLEESAEKAQGITILKADIENAAAGMTIVFKDSDVGDCLSKLANAVNENSFKEITAIYCNNISDNYVVYDDRIEFKLGNCDDLEKKIYQGLTACSELNNTNPNAEGTMTISGDKSLYFTEK